MQHLCAGVNRYDEIAAFVSSAWSLSPTNDRRIDTQRHFSEKVDIAKNA